MNKRNPKDDETIQRLQARVRELEQRQAPDPDTLRGLLTAYETALQEDRSEGGDETQAKLNAAREALLSLLRPFMIGGMRQTRRQETRAKDASDIRIRLDVARTIRNAFVPLDPNKMRQADPTVVAAAKAFIAAVEAQVQQAE